MEVSLGPAAVETRRQVANWPLSTSRQDRNSRGSTAPSTSGSAMHRPLHESGILPMSTAPSGSDLNSRLFLRHPFRVTSSKQPFHSGHLAEDASNIDSLDAWCLQSLVRNCLDKKSPSSDANVHAQISKLPGSWRCPSPWAGLGPDLASLMGQQADTPGTRTTRSNHCNILTGRQVNGARLSKRRPRSSFPPSEEGRWLRAGR